MEIEAKSQIHIVQKDAAIKYYFNDSLFRKLTKIILPKHGFLYYFLTHKLQYFITECMIRRYQLTLWACLRMVSSSARIHFSRSSAPRAWKWNVFPSTVIVKVLSSSSSIPMTAPLSLTQPRRTPRFIFSFDCNKSKKKVQLRMHSALSAH
jgi:hypothetical protein